MWSDILGQQTHPHPQLCQPPTTHQGAQARNGDPHGPAPHRLPTRLHLLAPSPLASGRRGRVPSSPPSSARMRPLRPPTTRSPAGQAQPQNPDLRMRPCPHQNPGLTPGKPQPNPDRGPPRKIPVSSPQNRPGAREQGRHEAKDAKDRRGRGVTRDLEESREEESNAAAGKAPALVSRRGRPPKRCSVGTRGQSVHAQGPCLPSVQLLCESELL